MQQTEIQTHGVALLIIELSPLCHKEQQLKIKIGKAVEFGGSAKRNTYTYVRFASWSKFPIWQWPLYLVADEKKFLRSSRKVSLTSGLNLSDIIEKQLLYNISTPAVLILHLAATVDRARVVLARLAGKFCILLFCRLAKIFCSRSSSLSFQLPNILSHSLYHCFSIPV